MEVALLSYDQAIKFRQPLEILFKCCKESSTKQVYPEQFYQKKIDELFAYMLNERAYLFAALDAGEMIGFLWACELNTDQVRRFHVLYAAISEARQSKGVGQQLFAAAEQIAKELVCAVIDLNVHITNERAQKLFKNLGYLPCAGNLPDRIAMKKGLQ